jgi:hypothetical protein
MTREILALSSLLLLAPVAALAQGDAELPVVRAIPGAAASARAGSPVFNSNCPQAACDTVWVGHSSSGPGGAFLGVGVGGMWDYDTDIAGTDSTQGWKPRALAFTSGITRPAGSWS